jgi:hypothetical protein
VITCRIQTVSAINVVAIAPENLPQTLPLVNLLFAFSQSSIFSRRRKSSISGKLLIHLGKVSHANTFG